MTTIIDRLVIELGFDTSKLPQDQQKAVESLRQLEDRADRAGQRVERSGASWALAFRQLEHPIAAVKAHFEQLADFTHRPQQALQAVGAQAARTGAEVEAGAASGAAGLRAMGVAGLATFAILKSLNTVMTDAAANAQRVFGVGVGAAAAGTPINEFSAISQALFTHGNVPQGDTQSWLARIRQFQEQIKLGHVDEGMMIGLAQTQAGINPLSDTPEQMLLRLATTFHGLTPEQAVARGSIIGMSPTMALALRNAGGNLGGEIEAERRRSITDRDTQAAQELVKAQNDLENSWERLRRTLFDDLTPGFVKFDEILTKIVDDLNKPGGIATAATQTAASLAGPAGAAAAGASGIWGWARSHLPSWLGGSSSVTGPSSSAAPTGAGSAAFRTELANSGLSPEAQAFLAAVQTGETGSFAHPFNTLAYGGQFDSSQGFPFGWDNSGRASHGAGAFQDEPATWRAIRAGTGITGFTPQDQIKGNWWWARHVYADATNGRNLEADLKARTISPRGLEALYGQWNRGFMRRYDLDALRSAQASAGVTNTTNSHTIGDVHVNVNVPSGAPAYQIGGAVAARVHDSLMAAQANTGLE